MAAEILDGRALATRIEAELRAEVETFATMFGRRPRLVVVLVGDVAASASYVKGKAAAATRVGIESEVVAVPGTATTAELVALVEGIARGGQGTADGILVQLPLPPKGEELTYTPPTPSTWSQYMFTIPSPEITPAVVAMNTGVETVGDDAAFVFAPSASAVPTPNTFSVFALSLINNGRRRIA